MSMHLYKFESKEIDGEAHWFLSSGAVSARDLEENSRLNKKRLTDRRFELVFCTGCRRASVKPDDLGLNDQLRCTNCHLEGSLNEGPFLLRERKKLVSVAGRLGSEMSAVGEVLNEFVNITIEKVKE